MRVSSVRLMRASRVLLATLVLAGVQASGALAQTAQDTYAQKCTPCHGANGKGDGPLAGELEKSAGTLASAGSGRSSAIGSPLVKMGIGLPAWFSNACDVSMPNRL